MQRESTMQQVSKIEKHANETQEMLESAMVNGSIPARFILDKEISEFEINSKQSPEEHIDKMYKAEYLGLQTKMVQGLLKLSILLGEKQSSKEYTEN